MKVIKIIKKDLELFVRDKKTLILVILAPILIMTILGLIFSESTTSKSFSGIKLGICNLDKTPLETPELKLYKFQDINGEKCDIVAEKLVKQGNLKAAIVIPKDFSNNIKEGHGDQIKLYLDNSRAQETLLIVDAMKALVQDLNEKIGTEFIQNAWISLRNLNNNLKLIVSNLEYSKDAAIELQKKTDEINNNLKKIDEAKLDNYLNTINNTFGSINTSVKLNITPEIDLQIKVLNNYYDLNCQLNKSISECNLINTSIINLNEIESKLEEEKSKINNILSLTNINQISEQIDLIKSTKENTKNELVKLNNTIYNYTTNVINIINDLNKTSELLDIYTNRDPKSIVRPITLNTNNVFGDKTYFEFLSPGLILVLLLFIILLITSSNIVEEKKKGTLARTLLSPINIPTILISKIIYFTILSIMQIGVMIIMSLLFGAAINLTSMSTLIFFLAAFNFITIGLLIGSLANSENTALLTSLLIILPMFFLSNLFFPVEIMPSLIKTIGNNLPLTLAIRSLESLLTYSSAINYKSIVLLVIYPIILAIFTYFLIKKRPTTQ